MHLYTTITQRSREKKQQQQRVGEGCSRWFTTQSISSKKLTAEEEQLNRTARGGGEGSEAAQGCRTVRRYKGNGGGV
jgi:hypothetical protein